jgi:hypothetical protein
MYSMNGASSLGQTEGFCQPQASMCFNAFDTRDSARGMCQGGYMPERMPGPCPVSHVIGSDDVFRFRPCDIAQFEICQTAAERGGAPLFTTQAEEVVEVEDNYTMYYVLGGVALLAVGTGAYFWMRK